MNTTSYYSTDQSLASRATDSKAKDAAFKSYLLAKISKFIPSLSDLFKNYCEKKKSIYRAGKVNNFFFK